jgi:transposase
MERFGLRDDQWDRIKDILPGREGHVGGTAPDNRLFVEAILYRFRTGIPWRDLPARFGYWKSVHQRFGRWANALLGTSSVMPPLANFTTSTVSVGAML